MRVTHVITRLIVGGAQENTVASVLGLGCQPGWVVDLIAGPTRGPEGSLEAALARAGGRLTLLPELVRPVHPWKDWVALHELTKRFRAEPPDVVHTHSGKAGVLGRLAAARAGVRLIVHTIHGPSFGAFQGPLANGLFRSAEQYAARVTSHFVVVAEAMKQQYLAAGIGRPEDYTTIYSGFDLQPFLHAENDPQLRAGFGLGPEHIVIGKIARLFKLKGHDDLLAIAPQLVRECPQVRFLLVGDGAWRDRFVNQIRRLGLEHFFIFAGLVEPARVPALVGIMDILVHLSVREGLARALPQALAAGRPVVAYDCDGAREVCRHGETGYLVAQGDRGELSRCLVRLARDAALRQHLGKCGQSWVRSRFDVNQMVEALRQLYLGLARGTAQRHRNDADVSTGSS